MPFCFYIFPCFKNWSCTIKKICGTYYSWNYFSIIIFLSVRSKVVMKFEFRIWNLYKSQLILFSKITVTFNCIFWNCNELNSELSKWVLKAVKIFVFKSTSRGIIFRIKKYECFLRISKKVLKPSRLNISQTINICYSFLNHDYIFQIKEWVFIDVFERSLI